jgi:hypothetical protein
MMPTALATAPAGSPPSPFPEEVSEFTRRYPCSAWLTLEATVRLINRFAALLLLLALFSVGCQRLNFEKTTSMEMSEIKHFKFSAPAYQQKVQVSITGTKSPVSAYLVKQGDEEKVETALNENKALPNDSIFGSKANKTSAEDYTFDATIPAKIPYTLMLRAEKSTDVKVKVTGR